MPLTHLDFALCLLRADASADGGEGRGQAYDLISALEVALADLFNEFGDMDIDRTSGDAWHMLAVQAAHCLIKSSRFGIAFRDLMEVVRSDGGILYRHWVLFL